MRIILLSLVSLCFLVAAGASRASLIDGMVAYYNLDSTGASGLANQAPGATGGDATGPTWNVADATGPGFTGNAAYNPGDGLSDRSTMLVGNALNVVDANNEFITVPFGTTELGASFSISVWTYLAPGTGNASPRFHAFEASTNFDVSWGTVGSGLDGMVAYAGGTLYGAEGPYVTESWQHTVHAFEQSGANTTLSVYVDGSLLGSALTVTSASINFSALYFGDARTGASGDRDWDGMFDEVALWDRTLSDTEASELYTRGSTGQSVIPEPSLFVLLGFGALALFTLRRKSFALRA